MASIWEAIVRWLDSVLSGGERPNEVDPAKVEAAIQLIQATVEDARRERQAQKLRVDDLPPELQTQLANQLAALLKKQSEQ